MAKRFRSELHMISVEEMPRLPVSIGEVVEEKQEANHRFKKIAGTASG